MVFTMKKLGFVSPERNEIQLIASEINSLRQVRMIILQRSNYRLEGLQFHEKIAIIDGRCGNLMKKVAIIDGRC